jgi:hypothetical protein
MEARCAALGDVELEAEIDGVLQWIERRPDDVVELMWGWAYDVPNQYEWHPVTAASLRGVLAESAAQGIYGPGRGDLHVRCAARGVEFTLCHESDVHVIAGDSEVTDEFVRGWTSRRIKAWKRPTPDANWIAE